MFMTNDDSNYDAQAAEAQALLDQPITIDELDELFVRVSIPDIELSESLALFN